MEQQCPPSTNITGFSIDRGRVIVLLRIESIERGSIIIIGMISIIRDQGRGLEMGTKESISIVGDTMNMGRKRGDILITKEKGSIGRDLKKR